MNPVVRVGQATISEAQLFGRTKYIRICFLSRVLLNQSQPKVNILFGLFRDGELTIYSIYCFEITFWAARVSDSSTP